MEKQITPHAFMLVGVPGSGKSTWSKQHIDAGYKLVSSDAFIEEVAAKTGKTYSEVFLDTAPAAAKWMEERLTEYMRLRSNILWDQTNLNPKTRAAKLNKLRAAGYTVTAVAFEIDTDVLAHRRTKREQDTGKAIARHILASMEKSYIRPDVHEGFDKVLLING